MAPTVYMMKSNTGDNTFPILCKDAISRSMPLPNVSASFVTNGCKCVHILATTSPTYLANPMNPLPNDSNTGRTVSQFFQMAIPINAMAPTANPTGPVNVIGNILAIHGITLSATLPNRL